MQAVLFDLWETLITDWPDLGRARQLWRTANVRSVLKTDGIEAEFDVVDSSLGAVSIILTEMHDSGRDLDAQGRVAIFVEEFVRRGGQRPGNETFEALEAAICTMTAGLYPHLMLGAIETLAALKARGLKTGLISNAGTTTAPTLRAMLDHHGLLPNLDVLVFSDEHQLAKPALPLFEYALAALECSGKEAVFVGDSPHNDVTGAHAAGMFAVVIGQREVEGIFPDARIETLLDLWPLLALDGSQPALPLRA